MAERSAAIKQQRAAFICKGTRACGGKPYKYKISCLQQCATGCFEYKNQIEQQSISRFFKCCIHIAGVIVLSTTTDSAAWIVHTVPGFPAAKTGYSWPAAENARGHLLICLTISESQINAIAASLLLVQPVIYYNDIPKTETAAMPYFNKLADGKISTLPPFTSRQTIRTQNANPVTVHIYSKSESSKYEIYKKVIVKVLKKTIKVWSRRDSKLKGNCRGSQRHIRLIKSPAVVVDHNTNLEADITNWAVSDPGNIFCHIDKPYLKNQTREPAMAVCIDNINIFTRFDAIAAQLEDCPK
ncbi:deoxyribonuclease II family protein [Trichinella spiralis]|uniref:deoxyribonuclease II family protein n=1 Tax=Trichinella spiralis TaxID=6334 RepID=UPI0001EFCD61|nr:deoxyribonuclease II family protein [Trichinella spiralis]